MMLKVFGLILGISKVLSHEEHSGLRKCGTDEYNAAQEEADPSIKANRLEFENKWKLIQESIKSGTYIAPQRRPVTIPIVWHILYQTGCSTASCGYLTDAQINYQLNVLNQDFSATNPDYTSGTPSAMRNVRSGNLDIVFKTQQIIRKATSTNSFGSNDNIKYDNRGGSSVVSSNLYLNFWSGILSGGLLGYAQFPGGSSATDGVVHLTSSLCPTCGSGGPYNLGRTATHEIGHWLNLRHIWGDNSQCTNSETASDFVLDTPASSSPNYGCPGTVKRCSNNPYSTDMYCNYMDYSEDRCLVMFTAGQSTRAWTSINQYRRDMLANSIAKTEFINFIYFNELDYEPTSNNEKCVGGESQLFYDNNLNKNSNSNKFIYGCIEKTTNMNIHHISDIKLIYGENTQCDDGYNKATTNINDGNIVAVYFCYKKEPNNGNSNGLLDITLIENDDVSKLDLVGWNVMSKVNINPSGIKLNFATKYGTFSDEESKGFGSVGPETGATGTTNGAGNDIKYVIGAIVGLIALIVGGYLVWKFVCAQKGFKDAITTNNEALIYGATQLSEVKEVK